MTSVFSRYVALAAFLSGCAIGSSFSADTVAVLPVPSFCTAAS